MAGSQYFIGWLTKLTIKRFILSSYLDYTFDITLESVSGTPTLTAELISAEQPDSVEMNGYCNITPLKYIN